MANYDDFDLDVKNTTNSNEKESKGIIVDITLAVCLSMIDSCSLVTGTAATGCQGATGQCGGQTVSLCHSYCGSGC